MLDVSLTTSANDTLNTLNVSNSNVSEDDIYTSSNKDPNDTEQCSKNDKIGYSLSLCDNAHSSAKI